MALRAAATGGSRAREYPVWMSASEKKPVGKLNAGTYSGPAAGNSRYVAYPRRPAIAITLRVGHAESFRNRIYPPQTTATTIGRNKYVFKAMLRASFTR